MKFEKVEQTSNGAGETPRRAPKESVVGVNFATFLGEGEMLKGIAGTGGRATTRNARRDEVISPQPKLTPESLFPS